MKKIILCVALGVFIFSTNLLAQSPQEIYRNANLSYENEDYEEAASLYEMLVKMDRISPEVFYNLGNSYFKLKKLGKAIVNYEKAIKLAPRDRDVKLNLKLARSMTIDKIEVAEKGFILSAILFLYERMNVNELSVVVSILYLAIITLLVFSIFFVANRKGFFYTTGALAVLLSVFAIFLASKIRIENFATSAVIISKKVDVRSGPKEDYLLQFSLHEGTKVRVMEERQLWYEIDLSKDLRGWLPKDSVEII
ncbi:tetratricopeptide repeat protein [Candidatus Omnitrophota bacterium]